MRLYCATSLFSQALEIACRETGVKIETIHIGAELSSVRHETRLLSAIAGDALLVLDDESTLCGVTVILRYLAEARPESGLAPSRQSPDYIRIDEWLEFLSANVRPSLKDFAEARGTLAQTRAILAILSHLAAVDLQLSIGPFLVSRRFSIADIYLWATIRALEESGRQHAIDTSGLLHPFENIERWRARMARRGSIHDIMHVERG